MAQQAIRDLSPDLVFRNAMRIMACGAGHAAAALGEAFRHAQSVGLPCDLELIVMPDPGRMIEFDLVIGEPFPGAIGEDLPAVAPDFVRKLAACAFEMALIADIHLKVRRKS